MKSPRRSPLPLRSRLLVLGPLALILSGCGQSPPAPATPATTQTTTPPPAAPTKKGGKAGSLGKTANPTADMDRDALKAYKKKMREEGKSF
jgi:hypothetical protein